MALSMSNATKAVSVSGVKALVSDILTDIDAVNNAAKGSEYVTFLNVVDQNWSGASRDAFVADFKKKVSTMESDLKRLKSQITLDVYGAAAAFKEADQKIYQAK